MTGAKYNHPDADYPSNPKSSNLYWWWQEKASFLDNWKNTASEIKLNIQKIEEKIFEPNDLASTEISRLRQQSDEIITRLLRLENATISDRTNESLRRFDNWFSFFKTSQILRFIVLEIGLPILFGVASLYFLFSKYITF